MTDPNYYANIIEIADDFVEARRKSDSTEIINMLRNALVRHISEAEIVSLVVNDPEIRAKHQALQDGTSSHSPAEDLP